MFKSILVTLLLVGSASGFFASSLFAQTLVIEKRISTDSASGKTTVSFDTIIEKSENITPLDNMIAINPLAYIYKLNLTYYRTLSPTIVAGLGGDYAWLSGLIAGAKSYGFTGEVRLYPNKKAPHGFYLAPNFSLTWSQSPYNFIVDGSGNVTQSTLTVASLTVGALAGWQWFLGENFGLGLTFGFDYYTTLGNVPSDGWYYSGSLFGSAIRGIIPALRFDICYAW